VYVCYFAFDVPNICTFVMREHITLSGPVIKPSSHSVNSVTLSFFTFANKIHINYYPFMQRHYVIIYSAS
jgi:hypothetical protein